MLHGECLLPRLVSYLQLLVLGLKALKVDRTLFRSNFIDDKLVYLNTSLRSNIKFSVSCFPCSIENSLNHLCI